ncbi:archaellar assembly protein FlaJ [Candidatus Woesearchaeota archaeon]|nr:archaellar assembly protein FlaJ [Candidatus Woesearchaeota archaeon]
MVYTWSYRKCVNDAGYESIDHYFVKLILPVIAMLIGLFIFLINFLTLPLFVPYLLLIMGIGFMILYPVVIHEKKKVKINENMHLFITYAGTIATLDVSRHILFEKMSQKEDFNEISKVMYKILYFAKKWNLGFATTCRRVGELVPSILLSDFLDRFAVMMDFGENLQTFLYDEQISVMDDFSTVYKESLENIRLMQEVFVSLTISIAFIMAVSLLIPLIVGSSIDLVLIYTLLGIIFLDISLYGFVRNFVPSDPLFHDLKDKAEGQKKIFKFFSILFPVSTLLTILLLFFSPLPFLVNVGIGILPLGVVGFIGQNEEKKVFTKERFYPTFLRSLGALVEIKSGAIISALMALRIHDFGLMNDSIISLYRRLRLGNDKVKCWYKFIVDSGSHLIDKFTKIFSESMFLGGNCEKIGEIVSTNFNRLLSLRKLKYHLASSLRGALYGSLIGFAAAAYVSSEIAKVLADMFSAPLNNIETGGSEIMTAMLGSVLPPINTVDLGKIYVYIGLMIIVHSFISSILVKVVDGGSYYSALFDFVLMVLIGAGMSVMIPRTIRSLLPGIETVSGVAADATGTALELVLSLFH